MHRYEKIVDNNNNKSPPSFVVEIKQAAYSAVTSALPAGEGPAGQQLLLGTY